MLTFSEKRLIELLGILQRLVDAETFNGALAFWVARSTGVKLPYGIEVLNDKTSWLTREINAMFTAIPGLEYESNPDSKNASKAFIAADTRKILSACEDFDKRTPNLK